MNTIKYLKNKNRCPICNSRLIKNNGEIYCSHCGLLVLDFYPVTSEAIDNALRLNGEINMKCPICGKHFKPNNGRGRPRKYCSKKCNDRANSIRQKKRREFEKKCKYCGKPFIGNKKTVYCSDECKQKAKQDYARDYEYHKYHHDEEYKRQKQESVGTIKFPENLDEDGNRDWEKEHDMILKFKETITIKK